MRGAFNKCLKRILIVSLVLWGLGPATAIARAGQPESATADISGVVWHDVNANGNWDYTDNNPANGKWDIGEPGEPGLSGWTITLSATDGATPPVTRLTGADGSYGFGDLPPGTYWLEETLIGPEWSNTTPIKIMVEISIEGDEIFVTPIDLNFGNEKPFLGYHEDAAFLPYTGGPNHPQISNGLLGALAMVTLAMAAVMVGSARARNYIYKVFLI